MLLRDLLRGTVAWPRLEAVAVELCRRYDRESVRVEFLEADNWLSVPCVVDEEWFVKIISPRHSLLHALITTGRNLGAFSSGTTGFFDHVGSPLALAEREFEATDRMHDAGLNAPAPVEAFDVGGLGVLVLEYLPDYRTLDEVEDGALRELAPQLYATLRRLHDEGLAHGDLRAENVLVVDGEPYFIDATTVRERGDTSPLAYDLACLLAVLAPRLGARTAVELATAAYGDDLVLDAREFLDFVNLRPDHDFDGARLKGVIERTVA